jgi:thiol:disulfide interchange protein DsbC
MQNKFFFIKVALLSFSLSTLSFYSNASSVSESGVPAALAKPTMDANELNADFLKEKINRLLGLSVVKVEKTAVPGIALLITNQGLFYASYNGDFFIQGKLYSLGSTVTDLAEESLSKMRLEGIDKLKNDIISYPAKNEKYVVTAFTDITCGYCRKMHAEMEDYNARGITFHYLAYPRSGIKDRLGNLSDGFKDLRSVWCSENPADALTKAKSGSNIAYRICDKPIEEQFDFGRQVGVSGTPAIILPNGAMIPGYQPPEQLEKLLQSL